MNLCIVFFLSLSHTFTEARYRRETSKQSSHDDMLLVQSIQITDKFGFEKQQSAKPKTTTSETVFYAQEVTGFCVNGLGLCFLFMIN